MKKLSLILAVCLSFSLFCLPVCASQTGKLQDIAHLLSQTEWETLSQELDEASAYCGMSIVVVTETSIGGRDVQDYADLFFEEGDYGESGVLFLIAMEEREWAISTSGQAIECFDDYRLDEIEYQIVPLLSDARYLEAFELFVSYSQFDIENPPTDDERSIGERSTYPTLPIVFFSVVLGLIVGAIGTSVLKGKMKSVAVQHDAAGYIRDGSFQLQRVSDTFLYRNVSKTARVESSGSSRSGGHGGGFHTSSSGISHGGRSGRF